MGLQKAESSIVFDPFCGSGTTHSGAVVARIFGSLVGYSGHSFREGVKEINNKIGAIWARVSTNNQKEISPDGQVERVRGMLEGLGITVPPENVFKVVWSSTDLRTCPHFQKLVSLMRKRQIGTIGMLDRDRIEAQGLQRLNFIANCKENAVELAVYQGPPFLEGAEGQLVELALALAKEKQVDRAQSGAKQGLADRARLRDLPPTVGKVYGMQWDKERRKYLPDSSYENACLIFDLWFQSQKLDRVGAELLRRGVVTPRGRPEWSSSSISTILKNPVYAGRVATLKYERREPVARRRATFGKTSAKLKPESEWHWLPDGSVERPIITWDQHLAIIERLKRNELNASRNAKHDYLLRGRIQCQLCGRGYFAVVQKKSGKPRYYCSKHYAYTGMDKCPAQPLDMNELHLGVAHRLKLIADRHAVHREDVDYEEVFEELTGIKTSTRAESKGERAWLAVRFRTPLVARCRRKYREDNSRLSRVLQSVIVLLVQTVQKLLDGLAGVVRGILADATGDALLCSHQRRQV